MRKRELAQAVASHTDVDPKVAAKVIDGTLDVILATVAKGEDVALAGFAKFSKVKRPARMARNPATGAAVKVKAKTVAKIVPLKGFKDVVLGVAPAPKLTKAKATTAKKTVAGASPTKTTRPAAVAKTTTSSATTSRAKAVTTAPSASGHPIGLAGSSAAVTDPGAVQSLPPMTFERAVSGRSGMQLGVVWRRGMVVTADARSRR